MAKLTAAACRKYRAKEGERRIFHDGGSLYLVVYPSGKKSFVMRFKRPTGHMGKLTLGSFHDGRETTDTPVIGQPLTLLQARQLAQEVHRKRELGRDPIGERRAEKHRRHADLAEQHANSYPAAVRAYVEDYAMRRQRRWQGTARYLGLTYVNGELVPTEAGLCARWADRPLSSIDSADIWATVEESKRTGVPGLVARREGQSESQARALLAALSSFFSWSVKHRRVASNPCRDVSKPPPSVARDRVLNTGEIKKFWAACDKLEETVGPALKLLLLTGQRLREVTEMHRSELTSDLATWTIPSSRTKNKKVHVVPLPPLARELIASVPNTGEAVFGVYVGSRVKRMLDAKMKPSHPWRFHDLRRTCVTMLAELGVSADVIELTVNHISGTRGGIAGVYNRSELLPERRAALERLANHIEGLVRGTDAKVVGIRQRRRR